MILITGGTGLLGSHVVANQLIRNHSVRVLYRDDNRKKIVLHLLKYYYPAEYQQLYDKIEWFRGDILDTSDLTDAMENVDVVIHCAAVVSFKRKDFHKLWKINREGTANVVNVALNLNVKKLVHVSSTAAIGSDSQFTDGIKRETNHWNANEAASTYSYTKFSAEKEVWRGIEEGLNAVIVNPSVMFGPGSWDETSLTIFKTLDNGLKYYTDGGNAFVDVRDVADLISILVDNDIHSERFLVIGQNLKFKELFDKISEEMRIRSPHKLAGSGLTELAWMLSSLKAYFTGKSSALTKESARSSQKTVRYSSEKLMKTFPDFKFRTLEDTISNTIKGRLLP